MKYLIFTIVFATCFIPPTIKAEQSNKILIHHYSKRLQRIPLHSGAYTTIRNILIKLAKIDTNKIVKYCRTATSRIDYSVITPQAIDRLNQDLSKVIKRAGISQSLIKKLLENDGVLVGPYPGLPSTSPHPY